MLNMQAKEFLTIAEAAKVLRFSEKTIRRRLNDGTLDGHQRGGKGKEWRIPASAVYGSPTAAALAAGGLTAVAAPATAVAIPEAHPQRPTRGPAPEWKRRLAKLRNLQN